MNMIQVLISAPQVFILLNLNGVYIFHLLRDPVFNESTFLRSHEPRTLSKENVF